MRFRSKYAARIQEDLKLTPDENLFICQARLPGLN